MNIQFFRYLFCYLGFNLKTLVLWTLEEITRNEHRYNLNCIFIFCSITFKKNNEV